MKNHFSGHKFLISIVIFILLVGTFFSPISTSIVKAETQITAVYPSFPSADSLQAFNIAGVAAYNSTQSSIRLTPDLNGQFGAAWWKTPVKLANDRSFSAHFSFLMTGGDSTPADGLTFTIQTQSNNAGSSGGGLGYAGITPSFAVEFDTYYNPDSDPAGQHIGIDVNGNMESVWTTSATIRPNVVYVWVDYNGATDQFQLRTGTSNNRDSSNLIYNQTFGSINGGTPLYNIVGEDVFVGFTAATGGSRQEHHIKSFYFNNDFISEGINPGGSETYISYPAIVTLTPPSQTVYTGSNASLTVCTKDSDGNIFPNQQITSITTSPGATSSVSNLTTGNDGCGSFTVTSNTSGTYYVNVLALGGVTNSAIISFTGSPPTIFTNGNPSNGTYGGYYSHTFTANGNPAPTYSVSSGSLPSGLSLNSSTGVLSGTPSSVGLYNFQITATNILGSISHNYSINIYKASTSTSITNITRSPSVYGENYTVFVQVSSATTGIPSGSVSISDGNNNCNITLSDGSGSCILPSLSSGVKTISATYNGSAYFLSSSTSTSHTVNKADTSTEVSRSVLNPVYGQSLSFSALVSPISPATITPSGPLQFYLNDQPFGSQISLSIGVASSQTTSSLVAGTHTYYADFLGDPNNNGSNTLPADSFTIEKNETSTSVVSSTPSSVYGQPFHLTATVSEIAPSIVTPVGQVQFFFNSDPIGEPVDLVDGVAQSADLHTLVSDLYLLANHIMVGEYSFSAEYLGNSNSFGSSSSVEQQIVNPAATELTISSSENPSIYGTTLDMTIKVTQQSESLSVPTGQVQLWIDGVKFMTPLTLDSNGEAVRTVPYLNLWPGSHSVTAFFSPSTPAQFIASDNSDVNEPLVQEVFKATSLFSITPSVPEAVASELITFSVQLSHPFRSEIIPTGSVQFLVDGSPLGEWVVLDVEGKAQCPASIRLSAGDHEISVAFTGDDYFFNVENSPVLLQSIAKADSSTEFLSVDPLAVVVGQPTEVSTKVSAIFPAVDTPSGKVIISNGLDNCEIILDVSGEGSCLLASTTPGAKSLTASYQGSDNHNSSTASEFSELVVSKADSAVSITGFSPLSPVTGQAVTIYFSVIPVSPGWGQPTGLVTIYDNDGRSCQVDIDEDGLGECQIVFDFSTPMTLNANYAGDDNFNPALLEGFNGLAISKADTSLVLDSSISPSKYGQSVIFTASISVDDPGAGVPSGFVQFSIDGFAFGEPIPLDDGQAASEGINTLVVGSHSIGAEFLGDDNFNASSAEVITQEVDKAESSLVLTSDQNPSPYGVSVLVTAQLMGVDPSEIIPSSGAVQFIVDGVPYGAPVSLNSEGKAFKLLPYTALWVGTHPITAVYTGNDWFNGSNNLSNPWMQVVDKGDLTILVDYSIESPVTGEPFSISGEVVGNDINNPVPTGTIEFYVNNTLIESPKALDAKSSAISDLAGGFDFGSQSVKLVYSGDDYYKLHTVETSLMVEKADTSVEITGLSSPSVIVGESVTVFFSVDVLSPGVGTPSGLVTVSNGIDDCSGTLTDGSGSCDLIPTFSGPQDLSADYAGDTNFNTSSTDAPFSGLSVNKASVDLFFSVMPSGPFVFGQPYIVTVQVSPVLPGSLVPVGASLSISNGTDSCDAIVLLDGSASCQISPSTLDNLDFIASFVGNDDFLDAQSSPVAGPQIIKADTHVGLSSSLNPGVEGSPITFLANVSVVAPGVGDPNGSIQFLVDGNPYADPVSISDGVAAITISDLLEGLHSIQARYLESDFFNASSSDALSQKIIEGDLSQTVPPDEDVVLVYHGVQNGLPVTTTITIPAGAITEEMTVIYHQFAESSLERPVGKDFVTHFTLDVYKNGELQPDFEFLLPLQFSMEYNPKDWDVQTFDLLGWMNPETKGWQNDGIVIISNDLENHIFSFSVQNTTPDEFSLIGVHEYFFFMPLINR